MATYEYRCEEGHPYTEVRPMTEEQQRTICPDPNCATKLIRVFGSTAVVFKGRGFYKTGG